jgi:hypothetical protein
MAFNVTEVIAYNDEGGSFNGMNASDVPVDLVPGLDIKFNAPVASSSVLSYAVSLFQTLPDGTSTSPVDITLIQPSTDTVRIQSSTQLIPNASYNVYIPSGTFGLTSNEGEALSSSFTFSFNTGTAIVEVEEPSIDVTPEIDIEQMDVIPEDLFFVSSLPDPDSILQYGSGIISANFNGRLPVDAGVSVSAMHPLGYIFETNSLWVKYMQEPIITGGDILISSRIDEDELVEEFGIGFESRLAKIGVDPLASDSIPYVTKTAKPEYFLDFDVNRIFNVSFDIDVNELKSDFNFMGFLNPFYGSTRELRLDIGPFVNDYNDFTLALIIHRHSITADQIWPHTMPLVVPTRISEYVAARAKKDILATFFTSGERMSALGDLRISGKDVSSYLSEQLQALDLRIVALESAISKGDHSTSPYTYYSHKSLPVATTSAAFGADNDSDFSSRPLGRSLEDK